ncbi:MAG: hypothetical protein ABI617_04955 [Sphingomicrobium sp.]
MAFIRHVGVVLAFILLSFGTSAEAVAGPAGHWLLKAEGRVLSALNLDRGKAAGTWTGTFSRPTELEYARGAFYNISGPVLTRQVSARDLGGGKLELSLSGGTKTASGATFLFELVDGDHAAFQPSGAGVEPWMLTRTPTAGVVSDKSNPKEMLIADANWPSNPEMQRLFDDDQAVRQNPAAIDWKIVSVQDETRRVRTKQLLDSGKLRSGDDFYNAAFIFQHGEKSDDFLMAHTLAVIANSRGSRNAIWIAAATLDRYLQNIGQRQIYGTQYRGTDGGGFTQAPYDPALMSDALRAAMDVPPLAEQEERRKSMEAKPKR